MSYLIPHVCRNTPKQTLNHLNSLERLVRRNLGEERQKRRAAERVRGLEGLGQVPERFADIRRHTRGLLAPQRVGSCQFCIEGTSHRIITMPIMPMQLMHCRWPASRFPLASRNVVLIALCTAVGEMMLVLIAMRTDASSNLQVGHASNETSCACRSVAARRTCWLPGLFFSEVRSTAVLTSSQPLFPALHVVSRYGIYIYIII